MAVFGARRPYGQGEKRLVLVQLQAHRRFTPGWSPSFREAKLPAGAKTRFGWVKPFRGGRGFGVETPMRCSKEFEEKNVADFLLG